MYIEDGFNIEKYVHCSKNGDESIECYFDIFNNGSCLISSKPINASFPSRIVIDVKYYVSAISVGESLESSKSSEVAEIRILNGDQTLRSEPILFVSLCSFRNTNLNGENMYSGFNFDGDVFEALASDEDSYSDGLSDDQNLWEVY